MKIDQYCALILYDVVHYKMHIVQCNVWYKLFVQYRFIWIQYWIYIFNIWTISLQYCASSCQSKSDSPGDCNELPMLNSLVLPEPADARPVRLFSSQSPSLSHRRQGWFDSPSLRSAQGRSPAAQDFESESLDTNKNQSHLIQISCWEPQQF